MAIPWTNLTISDFSFKDGTVAEIPIELENGLFAIKIPVAGYSKEDLSVELDDRCLTVRARKEENNNIYQLSPICRIFWIGSKVNKETISSKIENGLLIVSYKLIETKKIEVQ